MAKRHNDESGASNQSRDGPGETNQSRGGSKRGRRTFLKTVGVAAAVGAGAFATGAQVASAASGSVSSYLSKGGNVTIPAGTYSWDGSGLDISSGDSVVGGGKNGDVIWNLTGGYGGDNSGTLKNVTLNGSNKSGSHVEINLHPGSLTDGFIWPAGTHSSRSRAFKSPETSYSSSAMATVQNTAVAYCSNNTGYCDYYPFTLKNCVFANNNISGWRSGHAGLSDPMSATTTISNTTFAVTRKGNTDGSNSLDMRGLRMRQSGHLVVNDCYFVFKNVSGVGDPVQLHSGASGTATFNRCHFYNETGNSLITGGGSFDVTINDCTYDGGGSHAVDFNYSGNGFTQKSLTVPLPSEVTGQPAADDIKGVGPGEAPWGKTGSVTPANSTTTSGGNSTTTTSGGSSGSGNSTTSGGNSTGGGSGNGSSGPSPQVAPAKGKGSKRLTKKHTNKSRGCKPGDWKK